MKCISVRPPWSIMLVRSYEVNGQKIIKDVENREWPTKIRGPVLIHSSKTYDISGHYWIEANFGIKIDRESIPLGAIVGKADLVECVKHSSSPWFFGEFGFEFKNQVEFVTPIQYKGQLNFFDVEWAE